MQIQWIDYKMGIDECRLLIKLLRLQIRTLERDHQGAIGLDMDPYITAEYDLATDMYNDLIKLL